MGEVKPIRTICFGCKHHLEVRDARNITIWYNQFCKASPLPKAIDPVTGKSGYSQTNDLGDTHISDQKFHYCRTINTRGNCPKFEKK